MILAKISINRPILITVIILVLLIFGAISYFTLTLNLEPQVKIPFITVSVIYPGAGPKEIETQISKKIEDAVAYFGDSFLLKLLNSYYPDDYFPINSERMIENALKIWYSLDG